jgi:DNA-binding LytR/AlgR family response regulator
MNISCIILDDEELSSDLLKGYVAKVPFLDLVGTFNEPKDAIAFLEKHSAVDLVFLDIEMPNCDLDGMDFLRMMGDRFSYIFTTAHHRYAVDGFDYNAVDFLYKPIRFERFQKAAQKVKALHEGQQQHDEESLNPYSYVRIDNKFHRIDFESICWIESDRNYSSIYTENDRINLKISLGDIEGQLPKRHFVRIHKSYLVSMKKIVSVEPFQLSVKRQGQDREFPIGEAYRKSLMEAITQNSFRKKR